MLAAESPLLQLGDEWKICARPLLVFEAAVFGLPPAHDWVFFYSAQAVAFYQMGLARLGALPLSGVRLAALGDGTAAAVVKAFGQEPDFVGSGNPEATAEAFLQQAKGLRVLFPRARNSRQSIAHLLAGEVEAIGLVVYENRPTAPSPLPCCDYVALTSPMNVEAYLASVGSIGPLQRVIAIGEATAQALREAGVTHLRVARAPSEAELAASLLEWEAELPHLPAG